MTLPFSHLKASPFTPSSWVSCCSLLTNRSFLYHRWDSQPLESKVSFGGRKVLLSSSQTVYVTSLKIMGLLCPDTQSHPPIDRGCETGPDVSEQGQKSRARRGSGSLGLCLTRCPSGTGPWLWQWP